MQPTPVGEKQTENITTPINASGVPAMPLQIELRDWFAGQALAGILGDDTDVLPADALGLAKLCYFIADAMLTERARLDGDPS